MTLCVRLIEHYLLLTCGPVCAGWQECWRQLEENNFQAESIYHHAYLLGSTLFTTKDQLEDVIGDVGDHDKRDSKSSILGSPERLFYNQAMSARPQAAEYLQVNAESFASQNARTYSCNRERVFGEQIRIKSNLVQEVKEMCKKGQISHRFTHVGLMGSVGIGVVLILM